ncbi:MAG: glycoside hydrolase family 3 N-terminal domain-containing protein, partial [Bacteroidota bacterium]
EAKTLTEKGIDFRDLNKNGQLDVYENPQAELEDRVQDLISQMTLEEKAGSMFITMSGITSDGFPQDVPEFTGDPFGIILPLMLGTNSEMLIEKKMNSFNIVNAWPAAVLAQHNNELQKRAERTRLGIPVTIASDPRHAGDFNPGAVIATPAFSAWPGPLGMAAIGDTALMENFADIARREYLATGIRLALHPMADLATEPRWGRVNGTFGEDAQLSAAMTKAYVKGFQGDSLDDQSVACMTKHFSGGGPQKDGEDAHFGYGRDQAYPGNNFDYHVIPFTEGALPAGTAQIMPYYGIPLGQTEEEVAFAFNKAIITRLLRDSLGFDGVVCTDWNIITDGSIGKARAWGVEDLSLSERVKKVLDAGCDQFGGEAVPELIVGLVNDGHIPESRLDASVTRIMRDKFRLGLFDDPYVEVDKANGSVGTPIYRAAGLAAQKRSMVQLKNEDLLPLDEGKKLFVVGAQDIAPYAEYGMVVDNVEDADVVIYRVNTPFDPRNDEFLEAFFQQGRLWFTEEELGEILPVLKAKPSVVIANLNRPAILTEIDANTQALLVEFGSSDAAVAAVVFGKAKAEGKLPFELPRSKEAVVAQMEDVHYDSENPLYSFGAGN